MLGIPPSDTSEAAAFWSSFWPALYSGILYSIVTGIVVGIIVLFVQRQANKRTVRRSYERELSLMQQQIREAVSCPNPFTITSAVASTPPQVEGAMKVIRTCPISLWREELTKSRPILDAVHELQLSYSDFRIAAHNLDHLLQQFVRIYNAAMNAIAANDPRLHAFILGRLCGFDAAQLMPWIDMPGQVPPPFLETGFTEAANDEKIKAAYATYKEKRVNVEEKLHALIEKLDA